MVVLAWATDTSSGMVVDYLFGVFADSDSAVRLIKAQYASGTGNPALVWSGPTDDALGRSILTLQDLSVRFILTPTVIQS